VNEGTGVRCRTDSNTKAVLSPRLTRSLLLAASSDDACEGYDDDDDEENKAGGWEVSSRPALTVQHGVTKADPRSANCNRMAVVRAFMLRAYGQKEESLVMKRRCRSRPFVVVR
jgi:hypothetical protein